MNTLLLSFLFLLQDPSVQQDSLVSTPLFSHVPREGFASFYAKKFTGRRTANGERYTPDKYTCAHRLLPFGTILKVTNQDNCRSVWVRVNDRGPYHKKRIIDLSLVAAKHLGFVRKGFVYVSLEIPEYTESLMDSIAVQQVAPSKSKAVKGTKKKKNHSKHIPRKISKKKQKKQ